MILKTSLISVLIFLLLFFRSNAQIVNIECERIKTDTTGWSGDTKLGVNLFKDVNSGFTFFNESHLQYKTPRNLYLLKAAGYFTEYNSKQISNAAFLHLRHNMKITPWLRMEEFTQIQDNKITGIDLRYLLGAGPRFKIFQKEKSAMYFAALPMFEYEEDLYPGKRKVIEKNFRLSTYLSLTWQANAILTLVHTTYYQPLLRNINDFKIFSESKLRLSISKHAAIEIGYRFIYDNDPIPGIPGSIYYLDNSLKFSF